MKRHELKTYPIYFMYAWEKRKTFEIRRNDREFAVGDLVVLREFVPAVQHYSGREIEGVIDYITDFNQMPGFVVFQIHQTSQRE